MMTAGGSGTAPIILVLGLGDVASAVAHLLFETGHSVAIHSSGPPKTHRRKMAFADAWWDGESALTELVCRRASLQDLDSALILRKALPLLSEALANVLAARRWDIVVDARMSKRSTPPDMTAQAQVVIGLGPGFEAGSNCDLAIETQWGDDLGRIVRHGRTNPLGGEPRSIESVGRERILYAPNAGRLEALREIGQAIVSGDPLLRIGPVTLHAPISGTVRGIVRSGVDVVRADKVAEVDPRAIQRANFSGVGQRPKAIAAGVATAIDEWRSAAAPPLFLFEADYWPKLDCIPLSIRFHLDACGIKVSLADWRKLTSAGRRHVLAQSYETSDQDAFRAELRRLSDGQGVTIHDLSRDDGALSAAHSNGVPEKVRQAAIAAAAIPPTPALWRALSPLQRFGLIKLARPGRPHPNFVKALEEFGLR